MDNKRNIPIEEWCSYYSIETSFVRSLDERGLIELMETNETYSIDYDYLPLLEKYMHMHYDLDINLEGIEVISRLLQKIETMQEELRNLKTHSVFED